MRNTDKPISRIVWENVQLLVLAMTIAGQMFVGAAYLVGQGLWCAANVVSVVRDFVLYRPMADIVKDCAMTAITVVLIALRLLGLY